MKIISYQNQPVIRMKLDFLLENENDLSTLQLLKSIVLGN